MELRILSEADVRRVIDMDAAIDLQAEAFARLAAGEAVEGLRSFALSGDPPGAAIFNPAFLTGGGGFGVKVVADYYRNEEAGLPRMSALVALFDGRTGHPRTVMEGGHLTDLRTGAGTGLAARHLARADAATAAVIGAGRVARNQVAALARVRPLRRILLAARGEARTRGFLAWAREAGIGAEVARVETPARAVAEADVVIAATTSTRPVVAGADLKPGALVVAAGAHAPQAREVDSRAVARAAKRVIDSRADSLEAAGDLLIPIAEGILTRADVAEIAEILSGALPGRESEDEIVFYKSLGVPIQDLVTAQHVEAEARARGIGTVVEIGGDHD